MLEYGRIDISEEIDVNKTNASKECDICHYWYFKDIGFKSEGKKQKLQKHQKKYRETKKSQSSN